MAFTNNTVTDAFFDQNRNGGDERLNTLSQQYDSLRTYSWLISIDGVGSGGGGPRDNSNAITLACKQIGNIGFSVEDIAVDRINDKYYYPGKYAADETTRRSFYEEEDYDYATRCSARTKNENYSLWRLLQVLSFSRT